jgi:hypothetical protein
MTPPPTSIDGTDITGATIDGQDVQEITIDGQTVFTAGELPVGYSNLVAWYPFDSTFYGGANADDVTALFNSGDSGDSTAFDGTVNGATYQSSGGVTDTNAGANSGGFSFDGTDDFIRTADLINNFAGQAFSVSYWVFFNQHKLQAWIAEDDGPNQGLLHYNNGNGDIIFAIREANGNFASLSFSDSNISTNEWYHITQTVSSSNQRLIYVGDETASPTVELSGSYDGTFETTTAKTEIGGWTDASRFLDGRMDDVRIYSKQLSSTEVNQIYQNTLP